MKPPNQNDKPSKKSKGYSISYKCRPPHPWDAIANAYWSQWHVIDAFNKAFGKKEE